MNRFQFVRLFLASALLTATFGCHDKNNSSPQVVNPPASVPLKILALAPTLQNNLSNGVTISIDPESGQSKAISGLGLTGLSDVQAMASDPATGTHYALSTNGLLVEVDLDQATMKVIGPALRNATGMTIDGQGRLLAIQESSLHEIDRVTGEATLLAQVTPGQPLAEGSEGLPIFLEALAYNSDDNKIYAIESYQSTLLRIDPDSGHAEFIGKGIGYFGLSCLEYRASTNTLYSIASATNQVLALDTENGSAQAIGVAIDNGSWASMCVDHGSGELYACEAFANILHRITADGGESESEAVFPMAPGARSLSFDPILMAPVASAQHVGLAGVHGTLGVAFGLGEFHGDAPTGLAFDPVTRTYYGVELNDLCSYDEEGGNRTLIGALDSKLSVRDLAYDPMGGVLYAVDQSFLTLISISTTDASTSFIGKGMNFESVMGLAFDSTGMGTLYGYDGATDHLLTIDTTSGEGQAIGKVGAERHMSGLGFDEAQGVLYGLAGTNISVLTRIDTQTGAGTAVGMNGFTSPGPVAYDSAGEVFYTISTGVGQSRLLMSVDPTTGASTFIGELESGNMNTLVYDPRNDTLYGLVGNSQVYSIDRETADTTSVAFIDDIYYLTALAFDPVLEVMYAISGSSLYTFEPETGAVTFLVELLGPYQTPQALTFDTENNVLLGATSEQFLAGKGQTVPFDANHLISIDPKTGTMQEVGVTRWPVQGLAYRP